MSKHFNHDLYLGESCTITVRSTDWSESDWSDDDEGLFKPEVTDLEEDMKASIWKRIDKMGGPAFLPEILHFVEKSTCDNTANCLCRKLVDMAQDAVINWLELGAPSELENYGFMIEVDPDNAPNKLEMWWKWRKKFRCGDNLCQTCKQLERKLVHSAVHNGVLPPQDTFEKIEKLLQLEMIAANIIDRMEGYIDKRGANTAKEKKSRVVI